MGDSGFNGAAALTLRKPQDLVAAAAQGLLLQWGRSVNAAETICAPPSYMPRT